MQDSFENIFQKSAKKLTLIASHGDEHLPVLGLIDFIDIADVRVVKGRSGFGFLYEALLFFLRLAEMSRQKLEGDEAVEFDVLSLIDDAHATFAEFFEDFVMGYGLANHSLLIHLYRSAYTAQRHKSPARA